MKFSKLTEESGVLSLGEQFISVRLIKEKIKKYNKISVIEEKTDYIKIWVFRIGRIFGGPWLGPYPTISFTIKRKENSTSVFYEYSWPEYYMAGLGSVALGVIAGTTMSNTSVFGLPELNLLLMLPIGVGFFTTLLLYIDISYYRKLIEKEINENKW